MRPRIAYVAGRVVLAKGLFWYMLLTRGAAGGAVFLGLTTLALAWVFWMLYKTARALVHEPVGLEAERTTGRRRKELEREKAMVLKALKELEFDYKMGKVSEADFREIGGQFRARAGRGPRPLRPAPGGGRH